MYIYQRRNKLGFSICLCMLSFITLIRIHGIVHFQSNKTNTTHKKFCEVYNTDTPLNKTQQALSCPLMKTTPPVYICLYDNAHQASDTIRKHGTWESTIGQLIISSLEEIPNTGLIDIGASIGSHSLPAAKSGYKVIAVEPSNNNIMRLQKSVKMNQVGNNIIIVKNALSNKHEKIYAHRQIKDGNLGLQTTVKNKTNHRIVDTYDAIFMDDLLEVIKFKNAVIKIDIEGAEPFAFAKARKLFEKVNIYKVFMEWGYCLDYYWIKQSDGETGIETLHRMVKFFYQNNFDPWTSDKIPEKLDIRYIRKWPWDILWIKRDYSY